MTDWEKEPNPMLRISIGGYDEVEWEGKILKTDLSMLRGTWKDKPDDELLHFNIYLDYRQEQTENPVMGTLSIRKKDVRTLIVIPSPSE